MIACANCGVVIKRKSPAAVQVRTGPVRIPELSLLRIGSSRGSNPGVKIPAQIRALSAPDNPVGGGDCGRWTIRNAEYGRPSTTGKGARYADQA